MVHVNGLHGKAAQTDLLPGADLVEFGAGSQAVLLQLVAHQADGQLGGIDGNIELPQKIRQAADVVLVTVGDEQALDAILVFQHIGEIRNDQVNAEHVVVREHRTAVHQNHIPLALIQGDVLANLAQTAQRADVHGDGRLVLHRLHVVAPCRTTARAGILLRCRLCGCLRSRIAAGALGTRGTLRAGRLHHHLDSRFGFRRLRVYGTARTALRIVAGSAGQFGTVGLTLVVEIFH